MSPTAELAEIFRHPIKGIGSESLEAADLSPEGGLHGDRAWAILNSEAPDTDAWQPRRNFLQVASGPGLAAVRAASEADGIRLSHPDQSDLLVRGASDGPALAAWAGALWPSDRPAPGRLVRAQGHGMTDMAVPYVSLGNLASLEDLSARAGRRLHPRRFRMNLWIRGVPAWAETDWIGRRIQIGGVTLEGAEPVGRCRAPEADPESGRRNVDTNTVLREAFGHTEFGIYLRVTHAGRLGTGDAVALT